MESRLSRRPRMLACAAMLAAAAAAASGQDETRWYKGNTHAHTVLCGHADSTPEHVAKWYLDRGYHFLCLSEHNEYINPADVELPANRREDFILIPGQEITGAKVIHSTGLNTDSIVDWSHDSDHKHEIIQSHVDGARSAGGAPILNHPNFHYAVGERDILPVKRLHLFELYNGHPAVNNLGDEEHISTEQLWDRLLTLGMTMYGVASDDAHHFQTWSPDSSNPGRGWIMVRSGALTPDAITSAIEAGDFYASSGVILEEVRITKGDDRRYEIAVDVEATMKELESDLLIGRRVDEGHEGFTLEAIGWHGRVFETKRAGAEDARASFDLAMGELYLRCRVTYTRPHPDGGFEAFYAWTQPHFKDGRDLLPREMGHADPEHGHAHRRDHTHPHAHHGHTTGQHAGADR